MVIFTIWVKRLPAWPIRNWLSGFAFLEKRTDTEKQDTLPELSACATGTSPIPGVTRTSPVLAAPPTLPTFLLAPLTWAPLSRPLPGTPCGEAPGLGRWWGEGERGPWRSSGTKLALPAAWSVGVGNPPVLCGAAAAVPWVSFRPASPPPAPAYFAGHWCP